jgi:adenylate kinase family enzyme
LIHRYQLLEKEHVRLRLEIKEEKEKNNWQEQRAEQLKLQVEILQSSRSSMPDDQKKSLEKRIGQYVKEIDKCIAMLNE